MDPLSPWQHARGDALTEPFLMTVVGSGDHWLFVSSLGACTAGRASAAQALFPYETEDRLHRAAGQIGPFTALQIRGPDGQTLWRPFDPRRAPHGQGVTRSLHKRALNDELRFEELHHALGLRFAYTWSLSEKHGFLRRCQLTLEPDADAALSISLVDGLRAILPHGVDLRTQQSASVLVDAYKHAELLEPGLGLFALGAKIVDRAEPAEALRCSVAYSWGLPAPRFALSDQGLPGFLQHAELPTTQTLSLGKPCDFLAYSSFDLQPAQTMAWGTGADIGWEADRVVELQHALQQDDFADLVQQAVDDNQHNLAHIVGRADGFERSALTTSNVRHAANVLFNCMRGGILAFDTIPREDLEDFLLKRNKLVAGRHEGWIEQLDEQITRPALLEAARRQEDPDLLRLCSEYMPLTFSRRHGDPSRPWNAFHIKVREQDGSQRLYFEGNWRDVFQNWEALLRSFPQFAEAAIATFLNASTLDGHNPYRITRDGFDWERPDPEDPWANIGYWGDHQIIYLLKLLELFEDHQPGALADSLDRRVYVYADVPYRIRPYAQLLEDPHDTIVFDRKADRRSEARVEQLGADGSLVHDNHEQILYASLAEKLLVPTLAKLANLVLDAGIWMNTQRPEWNDANNALVGNGVSVVTLAYLLRHVRFLLTIFEAHTQTLQIHAAVADWLEGTLTILATHRDALDSTEADQSSPLRRQLLDGLGGLYGDYRDRLESDGPGALRAVQPETITSLLTHALAYLQRSLAANRRDDGLFHAYNLIDTSAQDDLPISRLDLMLEGQVAALSAGMLSAQECIELVDTLYKGPLYRPDQNTFLLYPYRDLPRFLDRHVLSPELIADNPLLQQLADDPARPHLRRDRDGILRFGGSFANAKDFAAALDELARDPDYAPLLEAHRQAALDAWEQVFHHHAYTGRSSSMYGYEGLGSVYWHMVSKLNLATQECFWWAHDQGASPKTLTALARRYYRLRAGLGDYKEFSEYGAFPSDAYSHTPPGAGARQPGMTGQVKEDILTRAGELGLRVKLGQLCVMPALLRREEFLKQPATWRGFGLDGQEIVIELEAGQLATSVCQVPVIFTLDEEASAHSLEVLRADGQHSVFDDARLGREWSEGLFARRAEIERIEVMIASSALLL